MLRNRLISSLIAGLLAAVFWTIISLSVGFAAGDVVLWAVVLFVATAVITYGISSVIATSSSRRRV